MTSGICPLCLRNENLQNSHIIPNAVFRKVKHKQGSGQLIHIDDSHDTYIKHSQDSWSEYLLCASCEQIISAYERYGIGLLRSGVTRKSGARTRHIELGSHEFARFKLFLTSILWRAAMSRQPQFAKVQLPVDLAEKARLSILNARALRPLMLGRKLWRLTDTKGSHDSGFSDESLTSLIVSPIPRLHDKRAFYTMLFVFEGYLFEFFVKSVPFREANSLGVHRDAPTLFVPYRCIFSVPELVQIMVAGYGKHDRGMVSLKKKRDLESSDVSRFDIFTRAHRASVFLYFWLGFDTITSLVSLPVSTCHSIGATSGLSSTRRCDSSSR